MISAKQPLKVQLINFLVGGQHNFLASSKCQIYSINPYFKTRCKPWFLKFSFFFLYILTSTVLRAPTVVCSMAVALHITDGVLHWSHTPLNNLRPESCPQQTADILQNTCVSCSSMSWTFQRLTLTSPEAWCILYLLCITLGLLPAKFWNRQRESKLLIFSKLARLETEHSAIFKPPTITFQQEINSE